MPLVTGNKKITIEIDGKIEDLEADLKKLNREIDDFSRRNRDAENAAGQVAVDSGLKWTEFRSLYSTVLDVVRTGQQVWSATVGELVNYGDQVQKLSTITGQSAEETSRQIQLADDLRVSYEALSRGLQFASRKGIDTSIEGLVALGEEYKKLPAGIERTQFLTEKFGRGGVELNKILSQTSETIRNLAASTPEGLIVNDRDLQALSEYNQSVDALSDSFTALKMNVAKGALPALTDFINIINDAQRAQEILAESGNNFDTATRSQVEAAKAQAKAEREAATAMRQAGDAATETGDDMGDLTDGTAEAEKAAKTLSGTLTALLSSMFAITRQNENFASSMDALTKKDEDLSNQRKIATLEWYQLNAAGEANAATWAKYRQTLSDITEAEQENAAAKEKLIADDAKASKQRIFDLTQQRLAADGFISSGEFEYLQNLAVAKGLVTKAAADQAIAESRQADEAVTNFQKTDNVLRENRDVLVDIAQYDGRVFHVRLDFQVSPALAAITAGLMTPNYSQSFSAGQGQPLTVPRGSRAEGGAVMPGSAYLVGERGPEMFIPNQAGQVIPNNQMGNNITINIASISNRSDVDYLAQEVARRLAKV